MYALAIFILISALLVVASKNVIYSLAALILTFFFSAALLISLRLEFLGYVLVVVYVGAIAILFLFVVMTLNVRDEERASSAVRNTGGYVSHLVALAFSYFVLWSVIGVVTPLGKLLSAFDFVFDAWSLVTLSNGIGGISASLYTSNFAYLLMSGFLLLLAMVGAVALTLEPARKNQNSGQQAYRSISKAVTRNASSK